MGPGMQGLEVLKVMGWEEEERENRDGRAPNSLGVCLFPHHTPWLGCCPSAIS